MKTKMIMAGTILSTILMLLTPCISAVNVQTIEANNNETIEMIDEKTDDLVIDELLEGEIDEQFLSIRKIINRIFGVMAIVSAVFAIPVILIHLVISPVVVIMALFIGWLTQSSAEIWQNVITTYKDLISIPFELFKIGIHLILTGEWPEFS